MSTPLFALCALVIAAAPQGALPLVDPGEQTGWNQHHVELERQFKVLAKTGRAAYDKNHDGRFDGRDWVRMSGKEKQAFVLWASAVRDFSADDAAGLAAPTWMNIHTALAEKVRHGMAVAQVKRAEKLYSDPRKRTLDVFEGLNFYLHPDLKALLYGAPPTHP